MEMVLQEKDVEENVNKEVNQGDIKMGNKQVVYTKYESTLGATPNSFFPNTPIGFMGEIIRVMIYVIAWNGAVFVLDKITENRLGIPTLIFGYEGQAKYIEKR